jgi:hypothetical protein
VYYARFIRHKVKADRISGGTGETPSQLCAISGKLRLCGAA